MSERLFISVLGNRDSGKSLTWNTLFGRTVRTGKEIRELEIFKDQFVDVFLVSGSAEERERYVGDIITEPSAKIVLCSIQYVDEAIQTFQYAEENRFETFTQWLNPGFHDAGVYFDKLGFSSRLLASAHTLSVRDGKGNPSARVQEIREKVFGWAWPRGLVR